MANGTTRRSRRRIWDDFRDFINRGNLVDLALAVVLGGAFGAIITSLVDDILMPAVINPILGEAGGNWQDLVVGPGIAIGSFLSNIVNFIIIALVLFFVVKAYERMQRALGVEQAEAAEPTVEEKLNDTLTRLADYLENRPR
jgi:large conductance mechanosensitive channel